MKTSKHTMNLVRKVGYAQAYSFKYSTRPGTPGADLDDQVAEEIKAARLERLQALLLKQQADFNQSCVGKIIDLLLEKPGRIEGQLIGRSPWLQSVIVDAKDLQIGDIVNGANHRSPVPTACLAKDRQGSDPA